MAREHPDLHVYHYAAYEITALKRLMGRYGTREAELDDLLRRGVFVDLLGRPQRHPRLTARLRAQGDRAVPRLRAASGGEGRRHLDRRLRAVDADARPALLAQIDAYNREDCIATLLLRDWLLELRDEALAKFGPFPLPESVESKPIPPSASRRARSYGKQLLDAGEELAAQLLDYHDRERKPVWWAFFDRLEMTAEELVEDAGVDREARADGRERAGEEIDRACADVPGAGAQARHMDRV